MSKLVKFCLSKGKSAVTNRLFVRSYAADHEMEDIANAMKAGQIHGEDFEVIKHCKAFKDYGVENLKDSYAVQKPNFVIVEDWMGKWISAHEALSKQPKRGRHSLDDSNEPCQAEFEGKLKAQENPHERCGLYCCQNLHSNIPEPK